MGALALELLDEGGGVKRAGELLDGHADVILDRLTAEHCFSCDDRVS